MNIHEQAKYYDDLWKFDQKLNSLKLRRSIKILEYFSTVKRKIHIPKLMDLGCGEGRLTAFLGEFSNAYGLELSPAAVERANAKYGHVQFWHGSALDFEFSEKNFDVVISQEVIEHLEDQIRYVEVCHELLKPGGFLILTTPNKIVLDHMKNGKSWSNQPIENVLKPKELRTLLKNYFEILEFDSIILNFGDKGILKIINSGFFIGIFKLLGLAQLRNHFLGKLGFGLHMTVLAKRK